MDKDQLTNSLSMIAKTLKNGDTDEMQEAAATVIFAMCGAIQIGRHAELARYVQKWVEAEVGRISN